MASDGMDWIKIKTTDGKTHQYSFDNSIEVRITKGCIDIIKWDVEHLTGTRSGFHDNIESISIYKEGFNYERT